MTKGSAKKLTWPNISEGDVILALEQILCLITVLLHYNNQDVEISKIFTMNVKKTLYCMMCYRNTH